MTRAAMLVWSAVTGLAIGLIVGISLLAVLTLVVNLLPAFPERVVERLRGPVLVLLLAVLPSVAALFGYLEGRAKIP